MQMRFHVEGMTCQRCVGHVTNATMAITGVSHVDIVLATGELTVHSLSDSNRAAIIAALLASGYRATFVDLGDVK
jgi:copper chaperone CopZ